MVVHVGHILVICNHCVAILVHSMLVMVLPVCWSFWCILVIVVSSCWHLLSFGALDDCHFVDMLLRILVHVGHFGVLVLSFCHCGALVDCHVVVILL